MFSNIKNYIQYFLHLLFTYLGQFLFEIFKIIFKKYYLLNYWFGQ